MIEMKKILLCHLYQSKKIYTDEIKYRHGLVNKKIPPVCRTGGIKKIRIQDNAPTVVGKRKMRSLEMSRF